MESSADGRWRWEKWRPGFFILAEAELFYGCNQVFVECHAGQSAAPLAERLSALAAGDLLGPAGGDGAGQGLLESVLEGEETVAAVSSLDGRDQGLCGESWGPRTVIAHLFFE